MNLKVIKADQTYIWNKLIIWWYIRESWKQAVVHIQEDKQKTNIVGTSRSKVVTKNQIWLLTINGWKERNEALHRHSSSNIAQSAIDPWASRNFHLSLLDTCQCHHFCWADPSHLCRPRAPCDLFYPSSSIVLRRHKNELKYIIIILQIKLPEFALTCSFHWYFPCTWCSLP